MDKEVIVLGMHRSGSSVTSSLCHHLGVNMGKDLMNGKPDNPFGHFEDKEFVGINEKILKECGSSWDFPPSKNQLFYLKKNFSNELEVLIGKRTGTWGWKDPRTCLTIDLYFQKLKNPYFIICEREKDDIAKSLQVRNKIPLWAGKKLVQIYERRITDFLAEYSISKVIKVRYETLKHNPHHVVFELDKFLGMNSTEVKKSNVATLVMNKESIENEKKKLIKEKKKPKKLSISRTIRRCVKKLSVSTGWKYKNLDHY